MTARKPRSQREGNALKWRAVAAFVKYAQPGDLSESFDDARAALVEARDHLGNLHLYVVVTSGTRRLAVFRVRSDGQLKRMRRPPRELRDDDE